uniref:Zona pellucida binding protein 2 n=1 Tax=Podarcis muralis TaxID=64176 RepID=A0A670JT20_PODMU
MLLPFIKTIQQYQVIGKPVLLRVILLPWSRVLYLYLYLCSGYDYFSTSSSAVNVYVKVHRDSPFLVCMDLSLSQSEVIDPNYLWIGPDGLNLRRDYVNLTATGKLMVRGFTEHLSGSYTCTLSYRVLQPDMKGEREIFKTYRFMVYVSPFAPGWELICRKMASDCEDVTNNRVQKAQSLVEEFFRRQQYIMKHEFQNAPAIHYVDHSLQVTRLDSCQPGFGKNDIAHSDCVSATLAKKTNPTQFVSAAHCPTKNLLKYY